MYLHTHIHVCMHVNLQLCVWSPRKPYQKTKTDEAVESKPDQVEKGPKQKKKKREIRSAAEALGAQHSQGARGSMEDPSEL